MSKTTRRRISDFEKEVPVIHKATEGFGYSFANLTTIFGIINPFMDKHGLGFTQYTEIHETGQTILTTEVFSVDDTHDIVKSSMLIPMDVTLAKMNVFQVLGSAITYFKRYQIGAMLGLITDADTDAATPDNLKAKTQRAQTVIKEKALKNLTRKVADYMLDTIKQGDKKKVETALALYADSDIKNEVIKALKDE